MKRLVQKAIRIHKRISVVLLWMVRKFGKYFFLKIYINKCEMYLLYPSMKNNKPSLLSSAGCKNYLATLFFSKNLSVLTWHRYEKNRSFGAEVNQFSFIFFVRLYRFFKRKNKKYVSESLTYKSSFSTAYRRTATFK